MTDDEKRAYLRERGWSTWYNPAYWVHPKTVSDPTAQDHTAHGRSLDAAVLFEQQGSPPDPLTKHPLHILADLHKAGLTP